MLPAVGLTSLARIANRATSPNSTHFARGARGGPKTRGSFFRLSQRQVRLRAPRT